MNISETMVKELVEKEYKEIPNGLLKDWLFNHLITPKEILLFKDLSSKEKERYWLISDHMGENDSSYRIIHSKKEIKNGFGLETTLDSGEEKFLGFYGSLLKTLESM